tara:strand:+ start:465 stop:2006 length:1542 start_codon:yes stop_codon:yes gene_type:complete
MDINKFKKIFEGLDRAYGQYTPGETKNGKVGGSAVTKRNLISDALWKNHLEGQAPSLGSIPIRDDNNCTWGCIDIDTYPLDINKIISTIRDNKIPLVPCRSKSGGAHLFLFTEELVSAKDMVEKLQELAGGLGYGSCEIFPKQIAVNSIRGDVGSWLNLPYFNAKNTMRYAYLDDGSAASLEEFFNLYDKYKVKKEDLKKIKFKIKIKKEEFDGPPCLEKLMQIGIVEGTESPNGGRDNALTHYTIYAKRKWPEEWQDKISEFNQQHIKPPLSYKIVTKTVRSHEKKDYDGYTCKANPMCNFCVSHVCKTREFGIDDDLEQDFTDVKKYQTENSFWFITIDKQQVRVRTDDLFEYNRFAKAVFDQINVVLPEMSKKDWKQRLKLIGASAQIEEMGDDTTLDGRFDQHLHAFVNDLGKAMTMDEVAYGKCFHKDGFIYFRTEFLEQFLEKKRFRGYDAIRIGVRMRELGGESVVLKVEKKDKRLWKIKSKAFERIDKLPIPDEESLNKEEELPF